MMAGSMLAITPFIPYIIATILAVHGLRKKSLSPSGAIAAYIVGVATLDVPSRVFGISLIAFYLLGSRATKVGRKKKAELEEGHQHGGGYRTAAQVLCNSLSAFVASALWALLFDSRYIEKGFSNHLPRALAVHSEPYAPDIWCPVDAMRNGGWSRFFQLAALGHFACCLGDTLASELGILSRTPPVLITSFKRVPPGTNGGITLVGLAASAGGGLIMGLTMAIVLVIESPVCRVSAYVIATELAIIGTAAGLFGSLLDSLMGATIQRTRYSNTTKRVLQDDTVIQATNVTDVKVISGINVLTNNQINLISSIATAFATAYFA